MSGPASGVMAAAYTGRASGHPNLITYDMGGTSTDVGLIENAVPQVSGELELEYAMPIHVPMVDVHTIGAGGGSIASVDSAGMLRVGPESAGARPGPICYGRGGTEPTITDANLILGRLNPDRLLGVDHPVTLDHVRGLIEEKVGKPLGLDADAAAAAILRIANDRMAGAMRLVSLSRGHDPRDFALFAFGGAGPLHATALARELAIPTVLVPARPGITNALGCVVADLRHDYVRTVNKPLSALDDATIARIYAEQAAEGEATIEREGVPVRELRRVHTADMQFQGQSHILSVGVERPDIGVEGLRKAFAAAYDRRFGIELAEIPPVLVNLHTAVIGVRPEIDLGTLAATERAPTLKAAQVGERRVWFTDGWQQTPVYARDKLPLDATFEGPAILEQLDCTTVVEPGDRVRQDRLGNLLIVFLEHCHRDQLAGLAVLLADGDVLPEGEVAERALGLQLDDVRGDRRVGHDHHPRPVEAEAGDGGGGGDVDVLRIEPRALAHRPVEHGVRLLQRVEVDKFFGDRAFHAEGSLRTVTVTLSSPPTAALLKMSSAPMPAEGRIRRLPLALAAASRRSNRAVSVKAPTEVTRKSAPPSSTRWPWARTASWPAHSATASNVWAKKRSGSWVSRPSLRGRFTSTDTSSIFSSSAASTCLPMAP